MADYFLIVELSNFHLKFTNFFSIITLCYSFMPFCHIIFTTYHRWYDFCIFC